MWYLNALTYYLSKSTGSELRLMILRFTTKWNYDAIQESVIEKSDKKQV